MDTASFVFYYKHVYFSIVESHIDCMEAQTIRTY